MNHRLPPHEGRHAAKASGGEEEATGCRPGRVPIRSLSAGRGRYHAMLWIAASIAAEVAPLAADNMSGVLPGPELTGRLGMNHVPVMGMNIAPSRAKIASNRRQIARHERKPLQAPPLARKAIELMVWEGHHRDEAAKAAGMLPKSLYNALRKHHVRAYYLAQLEVLRTSERARNIHRLCEIRDAANNMPAVQAIKTLEALPDDMPAGGGQQMVPGLSIIITAAPPAAQGPVIDATPVGQRRSRARMTVLADHGAPVGVGTPRTWRVPTARARTIDRGDSASGKPELRSTPIHPARSGSRAR
jgi:hypothetical protein